MIFNEKGILLFIISVGTILRSINLFSSEFWYDEAYTGLIVKMPFPEWYNLMLQDMHPPIYILLSKGFATLLGYNDFTFRLIPFLFGVLLIPLSFQVSRLLFFNSIKKVKISLIFSGLVALNPFLINYSQEARSYSFTAFIFLLSFYFYLKSKIINSGNSKHYWSIFVGLCIISFLTHYIVAFGVLSILLIDIILPLNKLSVKSIIYIIRKYILSFTLPTILLIPYFINILLTQHSNAPKQDWIPIRSIDNIYKLLFGLIFGVNVKEDGVPSYINHFNFTPDLVSFTIYTIILLSVAYIFIKFKQHRESIILLVFISIVPIFAAITTQYFGFKFFVERYFIAYFIGILGLISLVLAYSNKYVLRGMMLIVMLISITNVLNQPNYENNITQKILINKNNLSDNIIVSFSNPSEFTVAKYYLYGTQEQNNIAIFNPSDINDTYEDWETISKEDLSIRRYN